MKVYRFSLIDEDDYVIMGTEVDEPKPQIDAEFWARFMEGDCMMEFVGSFDEKEVV